jgi:hypothetical protein
LVLLAPRSFLSNITKHLFQAREQVLCLDMCCE